jgi:hypothetical protein
MEIINRYGAITLEAGSVLGDATTAFMDRMATLIKDASPADLRILAEISVSSIHVRFAEMILRKAMAMRRAERGILPKAR